jgi:hypothetical protein
MGAKRRVPKKPTDKQLHCDPRHTAAVYSLLVKIITEQTNWKLEYLMVLH